MLSWQPSDPMYQPLDAVSAFCCFVFFFSPLLFYLPLHTRAGSNPEQAALGSRLASSAKKVAQRIFIYFFPASLHRGPWKNHCRSDLAGEREVTLVPRLHRVITAGAAALCLFSTGCDTDGFDRRDAQSGGPRRASGGLEGKVGGELRVSDRREGETQTRLKTACFARMALQGVGESKQRRADGCRFARARGGKWKSSRSSVAITSSTSCARHLSVLNLDTETTQLSCRRVRFLLLSFLVV